MFKRKVKKAILTFIGIALLVWWISPINEGSILLSIFAGKTLSDMGVPWWWSIAFSLVCFPLSVILFKRLKLFERVILPLLPENMRQWLARKKLGVHRHVKT